LRSIRKACDRVLCLLPFELPFLEDAGIAATFVGHPFADQIAFDPDAGLARAGLRLPGGTLVALLPGSRIGEVTRLGPVFLQAAQRLRRDWPELGFAAPMASAPIRRLFQAQLEQHAPGLGVSLVDGGAREVMAASDVVLAASGTATLEAMLVGRPMVVAYRFSPLTYWLASSLNLVKVRHFSLPNLLAGEALVPEFLQGEATAEQLSAAVTALLRAADQGAGLRQRFAELARVLRRGASEAGAAAVLEVAGLR
jgi:lipid-A-disaccharide synthase